METQHAVAMLIAHAASRSGEDCAVVSNTVGYDWIRVGPGVRVPFPAGFSIWFFTWTSPFSFTPRPHLPLLSRSPPACREGRRATACPAPSRVTRGAFVRARPPYWTRQQELVGDDLFLRALYPGGSYTLSARPRAASEPLPASGLDGGGECLLKLICTAVLTAHSTIHTGQLYTCARSRGAKGPGAKGG